MRLINADELKKVIHCEYSDDLGILEKIDNAPTEPQVTVFAENASKEEIEDFKQELENVLKRPQGEWIPVSERLPKDRKLVLVTAYWHETYQVMQASYFGEGEKNGWWCVPFNNCGKHMRNDLHVIAWQPLPEPYKKGGAE